MFEHLALRWLEDSMATIFTWEPENHGSALHDWLWLMTNTKKTLHQSNPKMFKLYTEYIENNARLVNPHVQKLAEKAEDIDPSKNGAAVITAFTYFHNPYFAERWYNEKYQEDFEALWTLLGE